MTHHSKLVLELKMAMGKMHTDTNFVNPYTHAKIRIRTYARNPQWVGNNTRAHYPRISAYLRARPHTRKL